MDNGLFGDNSFITGIPLRQFTERISRAVQTSPELASAWVTAELSDVRVAGGHCYMELIGKNDQGETEARLRATIWRTTFNELRRKFQQAAGNDICSGLKVLVRGNATHHSLYGLSFNITDIDPSYTLGDMERLRREILLRLQKEGILDLNKRREMPLAPQKIAIISAEGAAGYGDLMNQLVTNPDGFVFYPALFPCAMQGDRVADSIITALSFIESTADLWDCVLIIRGGGSTTDLNGFDNYQLARAVATCGLPVIVGIGHQRDRNVLDDIAHTSLKTPTAVATFLIDRLRAVYDRTVRIADSIRQVSSDILRGEERHISALETMVPQIVMRRLTEQEGKLNRLAGNIPLLAAGNLVKERSKIDSIQGILGSLGTTRISQSRQKLDEIKNRLEQNGAVRISSASQKVQALIELINVLDPANTLKRGYSITRVDGKAITDASTVNSGMKIITRFFNGEIESIVQ